MKRRDTVVLEEEVFIDTTNHKSNKKKMTWKEIMTCRFLIKKIKKALSFEIYNKEYREILSRDAHSWFQLFLFYFVFYAALAGFFIGCLFIFYLTIDQRVPTYYNKVRV